MDMCMTAQLLLTGWCLLCCQVAALSLIPRPGSERLAPERTPNPALARFYSALGLRWDLLHAPHTPPALLLLRITHWHHVAGCVGACMHHLPMHMS
jgi:hypothetical protein